MINRDKARKISSANMGGVNLKNNGKIIKKMLKYIDSKITLHSRLGSFECKISSKFFYDFDNLTSYLIGQLSKKGFKVELIFDKLTISW